MVCWGATRMVIVTRRWAIKLPHPTEWRLFLQGLLANMQERQFSKAGWRELCPVVFSIPGGWFLVMPRAEMLTDEEWDAFDVEAFCDQPNYHVPAEAKRSSFGKIAGHIVVIDYGN